MTRYFAIYSPLINDIIGTCTQWRDVFAEEPHCKFIKIRASEYLSFDDWTKAERRMIAERSKLTVKNESRLVKL